MTNIDRKLDQPGVIKAERVKQPKSGDFKTITPENVESYLETVRRESDITTRPVRKRRAGMFNN
jgi:hypothetical protein